MDVDPNQQGDDAAPTPDSPEEWERAATAVIDRLLELAAELSPAERSVLAALLARAIDLADEDVAGFASIDWLPSLPVPVGEAIRNRNLRVVERDVGDSA